ncbi:MAG TPA: DUF4389 domain-containing protein [Acidimicrobiia bacterium]|nr:DUF4389 domain-containing protein [Acidimicrobiia bacterium]
MTEPAQYPVDFVVPVDDEYRSRGLAALGILLFAKTVLLIPHLILLSLYASVVQVVVWIGYWYILIQGGKPYWVENLELIFLEWSSRVFAWFTSTTDVYPTFGTDENHPAQVIVEEAPEPQNRWLALAGILLIRSLMAVPHLFILLWLTIGTLFAAWFGYVAILMTGRLPLSLHWYFVGFHRWWARTWAWIAALTDEYPPFTLKR